MKQLVTSIRSTSARLAIAAALCSALVVPLVAQAKPDHTANHIAKENKEAIKLLGKDAHRADSIRTDGDKVADALTMPEKKVFRGMTSAEKTVARHMAHIAKQIL